MSEAPSAVVMSAGERARLEARAMEMVATLQHGLTKGITSNEAALLMLVALQLTLEELGFRWIVPRPERRRARPSP